MYSFCKWGLGVLARKILENLECRKSHLPYFLGLLFIASITQCHTVDGQNHIRVFFFFLFFFVFFFQNASRNMTSKLSKNYKNIFSVHRNLIVCTENKIKICCKQCCMSHSE